MAFWGEISAALWLICTDLGVNTITLLVLLPDIKKTPATKTQKPEKKPQMDYNLAAVFEIWLQLWPTEIEGNENNAAAAARRSAGSEHRAQSPAPLP